MCIRDSYREDAVKVHKYINTLSGKHKGKPTGPMKAATKALTLDQDIANKFNTNWAQEHTLSAKN